MQGVIMTVLNLILGGGAEEINSKIGGGGEPTSLYQNTTAIISNNDFGGLGGLSIFCTLYGVL